MKQSIFLNKPMQADDIFPSSRVASLSEITNGMEVRKGLENVVISNGKIVNVVSKSYGHLPNENFFLEAERKLIDADINYVTRSINRDDRSFAADYILNDDRYIINVKNGIDKIRPMLRFTNSYDGSNKTSGHFGFFREVCCNGLHVAHSKVGFSVKHRGDIQEVIFPEIRMLVQKFMDNEFYSIKLKFEELANKPILNIENFVKQTAESLNLFKYEASDKNPEPSLNARLVIDVINREKSLLNEQRANMWIGYNAFNELVHDKLKKTFESQQNIDSKLFEYLVMA